MKSALIVAGRYPMTSLIEKAFNSLENLYQHRPLIIAADSGVLPLTELIERKVIQKIDLAIGDFDSINQQQLDSIKHRIDEICDYPEDKVHTDTELALKKMLENKVEHIVLCANFEGLEQRFDHILAHIYLLSSMASEFSRFTILSEKGRLEYLAEQLNHEIHLQLDCAFALFAPNGALGIQIDGARYEGPIEKMRPGGHGLGNRVTKIPLKISSQKGGLVLWSE